jgi:dihydroxyacetone kinase-like protein
MPASPIEALIDTAAACIRDHVAMLTTLDQAIGDGDHGVNMQRGFDAVAAARASLAALPLGEALQKAGMTLVMTIGGASGPLYGSLLLAMGKAVPGAPGSAAEVAAMVATGVAAVKKRGRSDLGEKTMLDVLVPVAEALAAGVADGAPPAELAARVRAAADEGLERTRMLRATKGRASFLGERSVGHLDPGACSSHLLVYAACRAFGHGDAAGTPAPSP